MDDLPNAPTADSHVTQTEGLQNQRPQIEQLTRMGSSSGLITIVVLTLLSYLAGSKDVSARPFDPDTTTDTALEATASSSGKKNKNLRGGTYLKRPADD